MNNRFDQEALMWDHNERRLRMAETIADCMISNLDLNTDRVLLDFGTGTGLVALKFQPLVKKVIAFDTSAGMLKALGEKLTQHRITNVELLQGTGEEENLSLPQVDIIVSSMALHHVSNIKGAAEVFGKALKPGGQLAIADLDEENGLFHGDTPDVRHNGFNRVELQNIFIEAGFKDIRFQKAHELTKPTPSGSPKLFTIFLMTARK
jgi:ubiquinone/menaquinone biosynthesis C-methylase UbiE